MDFRNYFQNAYVTRDLDKAVATLKSQYDVKDFIYFDPDMIVKTVRGEGPAVVRVAMAWIGSYQIEIIQPVSGFVHHYLDYLPLDDSLRFHHIAMRVDDWARSRAELDRQNVTIAYEGGVEGIKFVYIDARESLGHYVEYLWASPNMWKAMGGH